MFRHQPCVHEQQTQRISLQSPHADCQDILAVNAADTAHIISLLAAGADSFIKGESVISSTLLGEYYVASRNCLNRWMRLILLVRNNKQQEAFEQNDDPYWVPLQQNHPVLNSLAEQIYFINLLNRCWTTMLLARDRHRCENSLEALATNVYRGHQSMQHMLHQEFERNSDLPLRYILRLDMLRRDTDEVALAFSGETMTQYSTWETVGEEKVGALYRRMDEARGQANGWLDIRREAMRKMMPYMEGDIGSAVMLDDDSAQLASVILDCFWAGGGHVPKDGQMLVSS